MAVPSTVRRVEQYGRRPNAEWALRVAEGMDAKLTLPAVEITFDLSELFAGVDFPPAPIRAHTRPPI